MLTPAELKGRLFQADREFGFELLWVKNSLTAYTIIGRNASRIGGGTKAFFVHAQRLSLLQVALGLWKIFEREKDRYELCSVRGIYRLAKDVPIEAPSVAHAFTRKYGVEPSGEWAEDVEAVFTKQRPVLESHLREVNRVRHTRLAHLQQEPPEAVLPSIAAFNELLAFAVDFRSFVNEAFLATQAHPILEDGTMASSLSNALTAIGVTDVLLDFPEEGAGGLDTGG